MKRFVLILTLLIGAAPATQPLPPRASASHPNYAFDEVDPKWFVSVLYLDIEHDRGILPSDPDPKDKCFIDCNYSKDEHSVPLKEIVFYPSSRVFSELDNHMHGVDMIARGDSYSRAFREDGKIVYFDHFHDGKCVEGFSIAPDGTREQVIGGSGTLTPLTPRGPAPRRFFGDGGEELIHVEGKEIFLHHGKGSWHREAGGAESLTFYDPQTNQRDEWDRSSKGDVSHTSTDQTSPDELKRRYLQLRSAFFAHLKECADAGHFTLKDMNVEQYVQP